MFEALWTDGRTAKASSTRSSRSAASSQISDSASIDKLVAEVIAANPAQVEQFRAGKQQVLGFLVGQVMKASSGKANPQQVNEALRKQLGATLTAMNEVQAFILEGSGIRGALVRLEETWQQVIAAHNYPPAVRTLLGEGVVSTLLLASGLKTKPSVSLQLQGEGPLKLLLIQCTDGQRVRGMASFKARPRVCRCSARASSS